ncbi:hypothetical protein B6S59_25345 [Pseudomonas sp. A46]|nr:hypothetical protein [Pseudomonas sp. A46]OWJ91100.1 hypothetical protein B6S59_25345 [Pseudomonas sp. A46]
MDVMALIQQALDASTKLRELSKKVGDAEFKMLLADLHSALADAKLESNELKMRLASAQDEVLTLQQLLAQREQSKPTYTDEGLYSFDGEGRFCTGCWDVHQRKVRLAAVPEDFHFAGKWQCPACNAHYGGEM